MSEGRAGEEVDTKSKVSVEDEPEREPDTQEEKDVTDNTLYVSEGPFFLSPLIDNLPDKLNYTCCESYAEHIYLGTQTGELLHYFEIETGNYLLVSRTSLHDSKTEPIDKIILLPSIERACVLSQGILTLFLLPEFAPVPNSKSLSNINDVLTIKNKEINNLIAFSPNYSAVYQVSNDSFNLLKKIDSLNDVRKSLIKKDKLVLAKNNEYMIFDMSTNKEIPLFKVSETENNREDDKNHIFTPIIVDFSPNEVLVCSGGSSYKDEAMGLVINLDGDISQGTIALKCYPRDIIVCFPYILVNVDFQEIHIFKLVNNGDPILIQTVKYNNVNDKQLTNIRLMINEVSKSFHRNNFLKNINDTNLQKKEQIIDKLRSVPLIISDNESNIAVIKERLPTNLKYRADREKAYIKDIMDFSTNMIFYDNFNIYGAFATPFFMELKDFNEIEILNIENYLNSKSSLTQLTKIQQIETKYLKLLHHLLVLLHCDAIEKSTVKLWCKDMKYIDIRILFYLFDLTILGECWCPNGLVSFINKLKSLKITNKLNSQLEILEYLKFIKRFLIKKYSKDKEFSHYEIILITLDVNIFIQQSNSEIKIDLDDFEKISLNEIIKIIKDKKMIKHKSLLLEIYKKQGMIDEVISSLREDKRYLDLLNFLIENVGNLTADYKSNNLLNDLVIITINNTSSNKNNDFNNDELIKKLLKLLSDVQIDYHTFLDLIDSIHLKVHILEIIGIENKQDKEFLMDFYIEKLYETIIDENLSSAFEKVINEYRDDLSDCKPNILEYMKLRLKYDSRFSTFYVQYERIVKLCKGDGYLMKQLYDNIIKFNKDNHFDYDILIILLLFDYENGDVSKKLTCSYLNDEQLLNLAFKYNDFKEVDKRVEKNSLKKILRWITNITQVPYSTEFICKILIKHRKIYENDRSLVFEIIRDIIPKESPITIISPFVIPILNQEKSLVEDITLKKMLLKSELNRYKEVLGTIDK